MTRAQMINKLYEYDLDTIAEELQEGDTVFIEKILHEGTIGYQNMSDEELKIALSDYEV